MVIYEGREDRYQGDYTETLFVLWYGAHMNFCCDKFKSNYEMEKIQDDEDEDSERPNGKYATACCCGSKSHGGIFIVREIEYCPWCGKALGTEIK